MSHIGLNHRLTVSNTLRNETRALYEGIFGATVTALRSGVEAFTFADGSRISVFYVDPREALTSEQHRKAIWLEFEVDDETEVASKLQGIGIEPFDYYEKSHEYFQAPGGQVFRLAPRSKRIRTAA